MGKERIVTTYGGITVNERTAEELRRSPASEFLKIEQRGLDEYHVRYRFPEKGMSNSGQEYSIRKNINYFTKALAKHAFDRDGNLRFEAFDDYDQNHIAHYLFEDATPEYTKAITDELEIPEKDREDFGRFYADFKPLLLQIENSMESKLTKVKRLQYGAENLYSDKGDFSTLRHRRDYLLNSYEDSRNFVNNFEKLAAMDCENSDEVLFNLDCEAAADANDLMKEKINNLRDRKNEKEIEAFVSEINIDRLTKHELNIRNLSGYNLTTAFSMHFAFLAKVEGDDGTFYHVSIEMTAPADGKYMDIRKNGLAGIGIFNSEQELKDYHCAGALVPKPDNKAIDQIRLDNTNEINAYNPPLSGVMAFELEKQIAVKKTPHTLQSLTERLVTGDVDKALVRSSKQFRNMREAFEKLAYSRTREETIASLKKLNTCAQAYLEYKDPLGDKKKAKELSDYAKNRIQWAKDVLAFSSAELRNEGIKPVVVSSRVNLYRLIAGRITKDEPGDPDKNVRAENFMRSKVFSELVGSKDEYELEELLTMNLEELKDDVEYIKKELRENAEPGRQGGNPEANEINPFIPN